MQGLIRRDKEFFRKEKEKLGPEGWGKFKEWRERELKRKREERDNREKEKRTLLKSLRERFEQDFLNAYRFYQDCCTPHISCEEYKTEKINFVQSWVENNNPDQKPDPQQAEAIGAVEGNILVVARAGSGKTATLVNRALFLQQHCDVSHDQMLLLAFNRKAAEEMRDRIASSVKESTPHVMTFHALAYAMVHPEKILLDEPDGEQSQSRVLQTVVDSYLRNPDYFDRIRALMMAHFRTDWERIVSGRYNRSQEEMLRYRRLLTWKSLDGNYVKSIGEKAIANFLFEHDIKYKYEKNFPWNGTNYRPDFTIPNGDNRGVVIEYFGLKGDPDYDKRSQEKRNYWRNRPNWSLLEYFPHDVARGEHHFCALLKQDLETRGLSCARLSENQIWHRIKNRAIYDFTKVIVGFIQRCRKLSLTLAQLSKKIQDHNCINDVEQLFLNLVQDFYKSYLKRFDTQGLHRTEEEDFDGLVQKAIKRVQTGETRFQRKSGHGDLQRIRYVLIDEYQDLSELFYRLMEAVREQNPCARFFCVGDDWQAINGFAGSDLRFFKNFSQVFPSSRKLHLTKNYRSGKSIVDVGNALMKDLGKPACAYKSITGSVVIADLADFEPTPREAYELPDDKSTPAILRLVDKAAANDKKVVLLSRTNSVPWHVTYGNSQMPSSRGKLDCFLIELRDKLPSEHAERVTISTVHKYKGRQNDVVLVLDAMERRYPLLHPNWFFTHVLGDSIKRLTDEERRLFYVALTRAVEDLYILTEKNSFSPFLKDLGKNIRLSKLNWSDYSPAVGTTKYFIRIGNQYGRGSKPTKSIKEQLRAEGYRWDNRSKMWDIMRLAEGFSVEEFADRAIWSNSADGIEVRVYDHLDNEVALYHVDGGHWRCIRDDIREADD